MSVDLSISEFRLKLYPKDFDNVRKFYSDALGLKIVHEWDRSDSKGVMFEAGPSTIELLWPGNGSNYSESNGIDISVEVEDVEVLWSAFKDKDSVEFPLRHNSWGDTSFAVYDPEGFSITFFSKD